MKTRSNFLPTAAQNRAKRISMGLVFAVAVAFLHQDARATGTVTNVNLGSTTNFAILAGSGITVAGAVNSSTVNGDIGTFPTTTITGLGNMVLNGVNHAGDAVTQTGKVDLVAAYIDAAGRAYSVLYGGGQDLGTLTLTNGVYQSPTSFGLTGNLTLDGGGDPNSVWIFQAGSTLTTASSSQVLLTNGAQASHVFWQIGSSATLGTGTKFVGTLLALQSITLNTGATVDGRALARDALVTLDSNTITVPLNAIPEPGSAFLLISSGLATVFALRRRFFSRA